MQGNGAEEKIYFDKLGKYAKYYLCDTEEHVATISQSTHVVQSAGLPPTYDLIYIDENKVDPLFFSADRVEPFHKSCPCKKEDFCKPSGFYWDSDFSFNFTKEFLNSNNPLQLYLVCADTLDAPNNDSDKDEDLSVGAIVGISVGSFVFVCLLVYVIRHKIKTGYWPFMKKGSVPDIKIEMKGLIF